MHWIPTGRATATAALCVLGLAAACRDSAGDSTGGASSGGGVGAIAAAEIPPIGDPRAPLPAPVAIIDGSRAEVAASLAAQVRRGGEPGAAALLTALRLSGIGVRGPSGQRVVEPPQPVQGTVLESWEIRPLVALARDRRTVLVPLEELGVLVRATLPPLAEAPVERMLIEGLHRHATDSTSPLFFWATFVNALGGPEAPGEADLLTVGEPRDVVVNGLQASLLLRRFAVDLLAITRPTRTRTVLLAPLRWLAPRPLHAAEAPRPCALGKTEQAILDWTAYGAGMIVGGAQVGELGNPGLFGMLEKAGVRGAEAMDAATKAVGVVLSYAQFMATYGALETEIELDQGTLPRTRAHRPHGERRNLVGAIRFATGDEQAVNCFRTMLNGVGLDFSLPQNGPAKGAKVAWVGVHGFNQAAEVLHGGPEAIVQFVDDPANRIQDGGAWRFTSSNAVVNQTADDEGIVRLAVEGRGQPTPVPDGAERVVKEASVRLQVALKGADIFGDLKDASSAAAGGLAAVLTIPVELLYRMKWATAASHAFPVLDWGVGKGWSGWVDVTVIANGGTSADMPPLKQTVARSIFVRYEFVNGVGTWRAREMVGLRQTSSEPCLMQPMQTRSVLTGWGPAVLQVGEEQPGEDEMPAEDGERIVSYLNFGYDPERTAVGVTGLRLHGIETGTRIECDPSLKPRVVPHSNDQAASNHHPLGSTYGQMPDPAKESVLRGSLTSPWGRDHEGTKGIIRMSWHLRRT